MSTLLADPHPALTDLSEQERMFQEAVRDFAASEIAPKVMEMDRSAEMDSGLIGQLFELGVMGIEIPERMEAPVRTSSRRCSWWRSSRRWIRRWRSSWTSRTHW